MVFIFQNFETNVNNTESFISSCLHFSEEKIHGWSGYQ